MCRPHFSYFACAVQKKTVLEGRAEESDSGSEKVHSPITAECTIHGLSCKDVSNNLAGSITAVVVNICERGGAIG